MKRAIVYCRVSTQLQKDEGTSLDSQLQACLKYAAEHGLTVTHAYEEVFSGAYFHERPKLRELRDTIRRSQCDAIIFYAIDRLSRDVAHLCIISEDCKNFAVEMHCVSEDFDRSAEGILLRSVKAYVAEVEREKIRDRVMRGRRSKAESGKLICGGKKLYGYEYNYQEARREIVAQEAAVVRDIYQRYLRGESTYQIQNYLNASKIPSPSRKADYWHHSGIGRILSNPAYCGVSHSFKYEKVTTTERGTRRVSSRMRPSTDWLELPDGTTQPIISKHVFDAAQIIRKRNKKTLRQGSGEYLLRQRITCGLCGRKLRGETVGTRWKAYRCVARVPELRCGNTSLRAKGIEDEVWSKVEQIILQPGAVKDLFEHRLNSWDRQTYQNQLKDYDRSLRKIGRAIDNICHRMGQVDDAAFQSLNAELTRQHDERERVEALRDDLVKTLDSYNAAKRSTRELEAYLDTIHSRLHHLDFAGRKSVIEALDVQAVWQTGDLRLSLSLIPVYQCSKLELVSDNHQRVNIGL